jgi:hypothetical protein
MTIKLPIVELKTSKKLLIDLSKMFLGISLCHYII